MVVFVVMGFLGMILVWVFCLFFVCLFFSQAAIHVFGSFFSDMSGLVKESHCLTRSSSDLILNLTTAFLKDTTCYELSDIDIESTRLEKILSSLFLPYSPFYPFKCIWEPVSGSLSKYLMLYKKLHDQKGSCNSLERNLGHKTSG